MSVLKQKSTIIYFCFIALIFGSCVSNKKIAYFQFDQIEQEKVNNSYNTIFKPDDLLQITISAEDLNAVQLFNLPAVAFSASTGSAIGQPQRLSYLIDQKGQIDFPILGKLTIGGFDKRANHSVVKRKARPRLC
jgi:polysaccharide export outer membrane protein